MSLKIFHPVSQFYRKPSIGSAQPHPGRDQGGVGPNERQCGSCPDFEGFMSETLVDSFPIMGTCLLSKDEMINAHLKGPTIDGDDDIGADDTCEGGEEEHAESDQEAFQLVLPKPFMMFHDGGCLLKQFQNLVYWNSIP